MGIKKYILLMVILFLTCKPSDGFLVIINGDIEVEGLKFNVYNLENGKLVKLGQTEMILDKLPYKIFIKESTSTHFAIQVFRCQNNEINFIDESEYSYNGGYKEEEFLLEKKCEDIEACKLRTIQLDEPDCEVVNDGGIDTQTGNDTAFDKSTDETTEDNLIEDTYSDESDEDCVDGDETCRSCFFTRVDTTIGLTDSSTGQGVAFGDYDNDGDLDLFVANRAQQDFLYKNNGTSFEWVDTAIGLTDSSYGYGIAWGDYDNDGDLDLFVANYNRQQDFLYKNNGTSFDRVDTTIGLTDSSEGRGVAFGDYDNDGNIDLFVANSGQDFLYKNNGTSFERVDTAIGLTDSSEGYGVAWGDYDNDGDLDLFVANRAQQDFLYKNNGTNFERVDISSGITDSSDGTGVAWGDYDNDGDLDLFVANLDIFGEKQDFLYNNNGTSFDRVDTAIGLTDSSEGFGAAWGDYDNDGDLDLFVANYNGQQDFLYRNDCAAKSYIVIRPVVKNSNNTYRDAIGAKVYVDLDGSGDFVFPGTIMQEVGGNSGVGQNQLWLQFGLGDILNDVAVKIIFPGPGTLEERTVIYNNVHINQRVELRQDGSIHLF